MTDEQRKLIEDNHNLIYSFLWKHGLDIEEFYDLAAIGMCKAAITFNASVGAFSTYAYSCIMNEINNEFRKRRSLLRIPKESLVYYNAAMTDEGECKLIDILPSNVNVENEVVGNISVDEFLGKLKREKMRTVAELFSLGYSQKEIANILGCAHQNVSEIKFRLRQKWRLYN